MHIDSNGLILEGGDGGDTCQRQFEVYLRKEILKILGKDIDLPGIASLKDSQLLLEVSPGIYVRNPDKSEWYSDPSTTTRDQLTSPICYHSLMSYHGDEFSNMSVERLFVACLKRAMFAQNTHKNWGEAGEKLPDFIGPSLWSVFLRSSKMLSIILYPILILLDVATLFSVIVALWAPINEDGKLKFRLRGPNDVDDDNLNNIIMTAQYTIQTPISWIARKLYKLCRQSNYGNSLGETNNIIAAMAWYHRLPDGNPEIVDLAREIVARY